MSPVLVTSQFVGGAAAIAQAVKPAWPEASPQKRRRLRVALFAYFVALAAFVTLAEV